MDLTWQSDSEEQDKRDMARSLAHEFGHMVNIFMDTINWYFTVLEALRGDRLAFSGEATRG